MLWLVVPVLVYQVHIAHVPVTRKASGACRSTIAPLQGEPTVLASTDLAPRVRIMPQPDSPVAIVRADLRRMTVSGSGPDFSSSGDFSVDVQNVSDRVIASVTVRVAIQRSDLTGVGSRTTLKTPLRPGDIATVKGHAGSSESRAPRDAGDPLVHVLVDAVDVGDCIYEPARVWPRATRIDGAIPPRDFSASNALVRH
jgi:hypothetical protein